MSHSLPYRAAAWIGLAMSLCAAPLCAQENPAWTTPIKPFRIADNLYYVGSQDLASYLIVTPQGDVLINSNLETSVPQIRSSVEQLGFRFEDVKILLISHAHFDHDAGSAAIVKETGAKYMVMDGDAPVVESGGAKDFQYAQQSHYPVAKVDRVLHDGDEVRIGGAVLVAHKTPGHTRGCTTWTLRVSEGGRLLNVVIVGSWNVNPGYRLVDNKDYPEIASDFASTFQTLKALPCDVFLGAHGGYYGMLQKYEKAKSKAAKNPFIDPEGYRAYVEQKEKAFRDTLNAQAAKKAAKS